MAEMVAANNAGVLGAPILPAKVESKSRGWQVFGAAAAEEAGTEREEGGTERED